MKLNLKAITAALAFAAISQATMAAAPGFIDPQVAAQMAAQEAAAAAMAQNQAMDGGGMQPGMMHQGPMGQPGMMPQGPMGQ